MPAPYVTIRCGCDPQTAPYPCQMLASGPRDMKRQAKHGATRQPPSMAQQPPLCRGRLHRSMCSCRSSNLNAPRGPTHSLLVNSPQEIMPERKCLALLLSCMIYQSIIADFVCMLPHRVLCVDALHARSLACLLGALPAFACNAQGKYPADMPDPLERLKHSTGKA